MTITEVAAYTAVIVITITIGHQMDSIKQIHRRGWTKHLFTAKFIDPQATGLTNRQLLQLKPGFAITNNNSCAFLQGISACFYWDLFYIIMIC